MESKTSKQTPKHMVLQRPPVDSRYIALLNPENLQWPGIASTRVTSFEKQIVPKRKVIFYFTSLRVIPRTYEDCQITKRILQGYGVRLDERDVSMNFRFKYDLQNILARMNFQGKLPLVFVDGCCIGGAEEVRRLHYRGQLEFFLQGCEMKANGKDGNAEPCPSCADERFLLCSSCSGSRRVHVETSAMCNVNYVVFQACKDCNDYGLVPCPVCL